MNDFFNNLKWRFQQFMQGRYGADKLSQAQLWGGLAIYILSIILRWPVLVYLALALYIWAVCRIFSRNRVARAAENQRFCQFWYKLKEKPAQLKLRYQNRKEYKYFHCPKCHTVLRAKRGGGQRSITCPKCGQSFETKT